MIGSVIRLLDDDSINKIAAGEVIDRPASVVKELVENSLDAGARRINVDFESGGLGMIRVSDDGIGMSEMDVRMAVLRHATSKIRNAEDLTQIMFMGFRGEALPSIAAVSQFTLISRPPVASLGVRLEMSGGQLLEVVDCGADIGTTIIVSDLFFNTPVRLKFMKAATTESAHIHEVIVRLSLARPEVCFRLTNNGRTTLQTPGTGRLSDTLAALYGPDNFAQLVEIATNDETSIQLQGFIGKPSLRKSTRQWQSFTVNRRVVASRMLSRAVDTAYQSLLPAGMFPMVILNITMPSDQIDVNVHPQKAEVKFQDEKSVFRIVYHTLRQRLSEMGAVAEIAAPIPLSVIRQTQQDIFQSTEENLLEQAMKPGNGSELLSNRSQQCLTTEYSSKFNEYDGTMFREVSDSENDVDLARSGPSEVQVLAQFKKCYIVAIDQENVYLIDQHAAHERIMYDLLVEQSSPTAYQTLLIPLILDLDPIEVQAAEAFDAELGSLGFHFDWIGPSSIRLNELPNHIPSTEAEELFRQMLSATKSYKSPDAETFRKSWLETAACHMAVRSGQILNIIQMQGLVNNLLQTSRPFSCPHGRPTTIRLNEKDISRLFQRT